MGGSAFRHRPLKLVHPYLTTGFLLALGGPAAAAQQGPRVRLDSTIAHIWVLMPDRWDVRLYSDPNLTGDPVIHLTDDGLFVNGERVCSWPGGRYDRAQEPNMVLGYRDFGSVASQVYDGCRVQTPVLSTWGDNGIGTAAVFLEVAERRGNIVELRFGARKVYLDLNSLPGDPETPLPDVKHEARGFTGWIWVPARARSSLSSLFTGTTDRLTAGAPIFDHPDFAPRGATEVVRRAHRPCFTKGQSEQCARPPAPAFRGTGA